MNNFDINKINMYNMIDTNFYENYTLNDLKSLLYIKTKNNNTTNIEEINKIKNMINNKIIEQQNNIKNIKHNENLDNDLIKLKSFNKKNIDSDNNNSESESENSVKSDDLLVRNDDINKLYDRVDKKGQNQRFTQTSQKLFDRMFSEASYINKIGTENVIIKPFLNNDDRKSTKLGMRKNIMRN